MVFFVEHLLYMDLLYSVQPDPIVPRYNKTVHLKGTVLRAYLAFIDFSVLTYVRVSSDLNVNISF